MNSLAIVKTSLLCFGLLLFVSSCHKTSNDLKPYFEEVSFKSSLDYNGSTILNIQVDQTIQVGMDSIRLTVTNPNSTDMDSLQILVYFQMADEFDKTLDFSRILEIQKLAALSDTSLLLLSHPELPVTEDQIKFVLLNKFGVSNNPLSGVYVDGLARYLKPSDTLPTNNSFCKGVIAADGNFEIWMKLSEVEKKYSGQFIDTLDVNALYSSSPGTSSVAELDTIASHFRFMVLPGAIGFRIKMSGQAVGTEDRVWFDLNK